MPFPDARDEGRLEKTAGGTLKYTWSWVWSPSNVTGGRSAAQGDKKGSQHGKVHCVGAIKKEDSITRLLVALLVCVDLLLGRN